MEHAVIGAGQTLAGTSEEPAELGLEGCIAYPGGIPRICDALRPGSAEVMAVERVEEEAQNAAPVPGPDRCPRSG